MERKKIAVIFICAILVIIFVYFKSTGNKLSNIDRANKIVIEEYNGSVLNFKNKTLSVTDTNEIEKIIKILENLNEINKKRIKNPGIAGATNYSVIVYKGEKKLAHYIIYSNFVSIISNNGTETIYEFKNQNATKKVIDQLDHYLHYK